MVEKRRHVGDSSLGVECTHTVTHGILVCNGNDTVLWLGSFTHTANYYICGKEEVAERLDCNISQPITAKI